MLKIKHSQNINVLFLIRFFVLYVSVSRAVVRAEWRSAQPGSSALKTQTSTEKPPRGKSIPRHFSLFAPDSRGEES